MSLSELMDQLRSQLQKESVNSDDNSYYDDLLTAGDELCQADDATSQHISEVDLANQLVSVMEYCEASASMQLLLRRIAIECGLAWPPQEIDTAAIRDDETPC